MGKRELLLVLGFAVVGTLVYQLTARPSAESSSHFSVNAVVDHLRRAVRGNQANAEVVTTDDHALSAATTESGSRSPRQQRVPDDHRRGSHGRRVGAQGVVERLRRGGGAAAGEGHAPQAERGRRADDVHPRPIPREARQRANVTLPRPGAMRIGIVRYGGTADHHRDQGGRESSSRAARRRSATSPAGSPRLAPRRRADARRPRRAQAHRQRHRRQAVAGSRRRDDPGPGRRDRRQRTRKARSTSRATTPTSPSRQPERSKAPIHVTATNGSVRIRGARTDTRVDARNAEVDPRASRSRRRSRSTARAASRSR